MDTISRENNSSYLPVAGVIVGLLAVVLAAVALVKVSSTNKAVIEVQSKVGEVDAIKSQVSGVATTAETAARDIKTLTRSTQDAVTQIGTMIGEVNAKMGKMEDAAKKPVAAADGKSKTGKSTGPAVAGPDEYVIKGGDTFAKIAKARGVSAADLASVNPGVESSKLKVGQKIKLPAKK